MMPRATDCVHLTRTLVAIAALGAAGGCAHLSPGMADDGLPSTKPYTVSAGRKAHVEENITRYLAAHAAAKAPVRLPAAAPLARLLEQLGLVSLVKGVQHWSNKALNTSDDCTVYKPDTAYIDCREFVVGKRVAKRGDFITARILHLDSAYDVFFRFYLVPTTPLGVWGSRHAYWVAFNGYSNECPATWARRLAFIGSDVWSAWPQYTYDLVQVDEGLRVAADPIPPGPPETLCKSRYDYIAATLARR